MQYELPSVNERHDSHWPQGSISFEGLRQFIDLAKILAIEVFPTPRGPQNRYACANCPLMMELRRVVAIFSCPIRESNVFGLYFLADTMNCSIPYKSKNNPYILLFLCHNLKRENDEKIDYPFLNAFDCCFIKKKKKIFLRQERRFKGFYRQDDKGRFGR